MDLWWVCYLWSSLKYYQIYKCLFILKSLLPKWQNRKQSNHLLTWISSYWNPGYYYYWSCSSESRRECWRWTFYRNCHWIFSSRIGTICTWKERSSPNARSHRHSVRISAVRERSGRPHVRSRNVSLDPTIALFDRPEKKRSIFCKGCLDDNSPEQWHDQSKAWLLSLQK